MFIKKTKKGTQAMTYLKSATKPGAGDIDRNSYQPLPFGWSFT